MGVDLEHVGDPEALQWCAQWGNVFAILGCDNRLGEWGLEKPAFRNPRAVKSRIDAFEVGRGLFDDLLFAHFEEWIMHGTVVAQVNQVAPSIFGGWAVVRMLDQAGEGIAGIAGIDPVAIR